MALTNQVYDALSPRRYSKTATPSIHEDADTLYKSLRIEGTGGSSYPDGEWEWNGSYQVTVAPGDIGNIYSYGGSLHPHYPKPKDPLSRRYGGKKKRRGWDVNLTVGYGEYRERVTYRLVENQVFTGIKKARIALVKAIQEFESSNLFLTHVWSKVLAPDRLIPILKEVNGEIYWVASTWGEARVAVMGSQSNYGEMSLPLGKGTFYIKEDQFDRVYDTLEDGRNDYSTGRNVYTHSDYSWLTQSNQFSRVKAPDMSETIEVALWNPGSNILADYNAMARYDAFFKAIS